MLFSKADAKVAQFCLSTKLFTHFLNRKMQAHEDNEDTLVRVTNIGSQA